jgi:hypothetical protein
MTGEVNRPTTAETVEEPVRRLSFAGLWHSGVGDLAARSEDVLRDEFGRRRA